MNLFKKIVLGLDYLLYTFLISKIPFSPGVFIRRLYFSIMMAGNFGKSVSVGENVKKGSYKLLQIDNYVSILGNVVLGYAIGGRIILKEGALIGHDVLFVNNMHAYKNKKLRVQDQGYIEPFEDIEVGRNTWLGARSIILPGVTIGDYSIIGAGAVVTKSIPKNSIAVGVPARVIKKR